MMRGAQLSLLLLTTAASFACQPPRVERVVLVSIDTLRADYVSVYGAARKNKLGVSHWAVQDFVEDRE